MSASLTGSVCSDTSGSITPIYSLALTIINLLRVKGYEISHAPDGAVGIQKAFEILPDLILCDISMKEISGYDVFNVLKESSATAMIPFVFLTGKSELKDIRFGMQLGADDYIVKPFEYDELITSIATRINKAEANKKANEEKFIALSMISPYGIFIYQGAKFIETNPSLSNMLGYSREELLQMGFRDLIIEANRTQAMDKINRCLQGFEKEIHINFHVKHKDGHVLSIEIYGIEGLKVKGKTSLLGIFSSLKSLEPEDSTLEDLSPYEIREFEKVVDSIGGKGLYVSEGLINKLRTLFSKNQDNEEKSSENIVFSDRELEILTLVCKGLSTKEIADKLFISSRTVEKHRANLMTKIEAKNIIEVIIYGLKHQLIDI